MGHFGDVSHHAYEHREVLLLQAEARRDEESRRERAIVSIWRIVWGEQERDSMLV